MHDDGPMRELSQNDLDWFAARLSIAVHDTNREFRMSAYELKEALRGTPGAENLTISTAPNGNQIVSVAGKTVEVGPMATNEEITAALANPFATIGTTDMSITGFQPGSIKAAIDAAQLAARERQAQSMAKLAAAGAKAASVADAIDQVSARMEREADDALQELAAFTNGGPA